MPRCIRMSVLLISLVLLARPAAGAGATDRITALVTEMKEGHEEVRNLACDALAEMGPEARAAVPELLAGLRDRTWPGRGGTARALLHIAPTDPIVVTEVLKALGDSPARVREDVAFALGNVTPPATWAVPKLAELIKDKDWSVAYAAADSLEQLGPDAAAAVPALIGLLRASDESVRSAAIRALGKIGPEAKPAVATLVVLLGSADEGDRVRASAALRHLAGVADAAIPALVRAMNDELPGVRLNAVFTLGRLGYKQSAALPAFTPPLKPELQSVRTAFALGAAASKDPGRREATLKLMEMMDDPDKLIRALVTDEAENAGAAGIPTLIEALSSPDRKLRRQAARVFLLISREKPVNQSLAAESAVRALTGAMRDPEPEIRGTIGGALAMFHSPIAVPALLEAARDKAWDIRANAAWALGEVHGDPQVRRIAIQALVELLKDDNRLVRRFAAKGLGQFGPAASDAVPLLIERLDDRDEREIVMPLPPRPLSSEETAQLEEARKLFQQFGGVPSAAVGALGQIGPSARAALPALLAHLMNKDGSSWRDIVRTLGAIGPDAGASIPALVKLLDKKPDCYGAAEALARMGEPGAEALAAALKNEDANYAAELELGRAGRSAIPSLIRALGDDDADVRRSAAKALGENGSRAASAVPALVDAVKNRSPLASEALVQIGPAAIPPLVEMLKSTEWRTREVVSRALGGMGTDAAPATQDLAAALEGGSPQSREAAAWALGRIGPAAKSATPALKKLLDDGDEGVRNAAAKALQDILVVVPGR